MFKRFILCLLSAVVIGCSSTETARNNDNVDLYSAIVRLGTEDSLFCTAFVISSKYAVTASHCVAGLFGVRSDLVVANSLGSIITKVDVVGGDPRVDFALIKGDFSNFRTLKLDNGKRTFSSKKIIACGYPHGSPRLKCSKFNYMGTRFFQLLGKGELLQPGHSGGPAFDAETGVVIGVNSAVDESGSLFAPILSIPTLIHHDKQREVTE